MTRARRKEGGSNTVEGGLARCYLGLHRFVYFEIAGFNALRQGNLLEMQNMKETKNYKMHSTTATQYQISLHFLRLAYSQATLLFIIFCVQSFGTCCA